MSAQNTIYSVIDVETTGGRVNNRIMEIAIVKTDGYKILEQYDTLVNPHRKIDKFVIQLTGITNDMVSDAPDFSEIIEEIEAFTKDTIFVAHNVAFDYSIIKKEYKIADNNFKRNKICTVQLSRKLLKDQESFSLGKLAASLGIELKNRHRALGDAEATAKLLIYIINKYNEEKVLEQSSQNNHIIAFKDEITNDVIEELPEEPGVFRFFNKNGKIIYIGFAKNIFATVTKFLIQEGKLKTHHGFWEEMFSIDYEVFNSFLLTQLNAYSEIIKHKPVYNKSKMYRKLPVGVFEKNEDLIKSPFILENNHKDKALWRFSNMNSARRFIRRIKMKGIKTPSFSGDKKKFDIHYKTLIEEFLLKELYPKRNFFIVREVSFQNIAYVVCIKDFVYQGFGVIDLEYAEKNIETLKECIKPQISNQTIQKMIKKYTDKAKGIKIVEF